MASECDNEETANIVETEAADSDDRTKTVSRVSEIIPHHNAVFAIWQLFGFQPTDNQVRDDPIFRRCHLKTHQSINQSIEKFLEWPK